MRAQRISASLLALALLLTVTGGSLAQGPEGGMGPAAQDAGTQPLAADASPLAVEADLAAGFYYQGVLTENGAPVSGNRQMEFKLWDAASGGAQVGSTLTPTVAVSKGQFSVALTWGPSQINGRALWLGVRAKDAGGVWRDLGRRQILAVPYAMSLMPGADIIGADTGDVLLLQSAASGYPLRAITTAAGYDAIWGTGTNQGVYGDTTGTGSSDSGVFGGAFASSGSAKGGYFYSSKGIGVYGTSSTVEGVYGESTTHDGVTGRSEVTGHSGVYGYSLNGYGVSGRSDATHGVQGWTNATSGAAHGVYGTTASSGGAGVYGANGSTGAGVAGFRSGYSPADQTLFWIPGGQFGGNNGVVGLSKTDGGYGVIGWNKATTGSWSIGVYGDTDSPSGWAGYFASSGNGVYVSTPAGKSGLSVVGGTKSGVVATDDGSRLLYSEEATEVWFADYGFGKLAAGAATITIDPLFAQTVNLAVPYHVFLQAYGDAEIYVTNRSATGFEVRLRDGDPAVEFSYRIVAKRAGYEVDRLARASWADNDVNLHPELAGTAGALQQVVPVDVTAP